MSALPQPRADMSAADEARRTRARIRAGALRGQTSGLAPGFVQANLVILPAALAPDFRRFCALNPKPCPLLAESAPGDPRLPALGADIDVRTDLPLYRLWRGGELAGEAHDIGAHWRGDLTAFALGCSFSFEEALMAEGLEVRNAALGRNVPMYRTSIQCAPAGPFSGPLVVSMRPFKAADAIRAVEITARYPRVHGAPVHIGRPDLIGIKDLARPDYGDAVPVHDGELPLFWACGVTPQAALAAARPDFAVTHAPGAMLITDLRNAELALR